MCGVGLGPRSHRTHKHICMCIIYTPAVAAFSKNAKHVVGKRVRPSGVKRPLFGSEGQKGGGTEEK